MKRLIFLIPAVLALLLAALWGARESGSVIVTLNGQKTPVPLKS